MSFQQPLLQGVAADPSITFYDGNYYLLYNKLGYDNRIMGRKSPTLAGLRFAPDQVVYRPGDDHPPEVGTGLGYGSFMTSYNGRWYIYRSGKPPGGTSKPFVLESEGTDPFGEYHFKAILVSESEYGYAPSPLTINGQRYVTRTENGRIYIAALSNPWTVSSSWHLLTEPTAAWECANNRCLDEGGSLVERDGKVYFIFSAGGYESPDYCVGMLTANVTADPLQQSSWTKSAGCVFKRNDAARAYGPASMIFFKSPDGSEDWVVYHIKTTTALTGSDRLLQARRVDWTTGTPNFGQPYANDTYVPAPSGESTSSPPGVVTYETEAGTVVGSPVLTSSFASGGSYVGSLSSGRSVTLNVGALSYSTHRAYLHYANSGTAASITVRVNGGANPITVRVPSTGTGTAGRFPIDRYVAVDLDLAAGSNTVAIEGGTGAVDVDRIHVDHHFAVGGAALASRGPQGLHLFRVKAGNVWSRSTADGSTWSAWNRPLAAPTSGGRQLPGAVSRKPNWLDLFVVGPQRHRLPSILG